ncbi:MAG TPA: ferredoxin--NADP reductase [Burkholderiaceae bacterium]|nr:ferredoxin--NADP reductase [Burkholderiaceae bacterium]
MDGSAALEPNVADATAPRKKLPGELPPDKYTTETITWIRPWTDHLFSFRTTRSAGYRFTPGQFARLGLYREDECPNPSGKSGPRYVWRAYSIASANYDEHLEFYSIVVPDGDFTTKLAELKVGDKVLVEKMNYGFLTTDRFEQGKDLWMLSSGTGLAPFISILYDLEAWEQYERLIVVHSVRETSELAYRDTIEGLKNHEYFGELLAENPGKLVYVPIVTREAVPGMLNERITSALANGKLEEAAGVKLDRERSRIMICGNPQMVDDIRGQLTEAGYVVSRRGQPGHMAVENYW